MAKSSKAAPAASKSKAKTFARAKSAAKSAARARTAKGTALLRNRPAKAKPQKLKVKALRQKQPAVKAAA